MNQTVGKGLRSLHANEYTSLPHIASSSSSFPWLSQHLSSALLTKAHITPLRLRRSPRTYPPPPTPPHLSHAYLPPARHPGKPQANDSHRSGAGAGRKRTIGTFVRVGSFVGGCGAVEMGRWLHNHERVGARRRACGLPGGLHRNLQDGCMGLTSERIGWGLYGVSMRGA